MSHEDLTSIFNQYYTKIFWYSLQYLWNVWCITCAWRGRATLVIAHAVQEKHKNATVLSPRREVESFSSEASPSLSLYTAPFPLNPFLFVSLHHSNSAFLFSLSRLLSSHAILHPHTLLFRDFLPRGCLKSEANFWTFIL